jgi:hypothetical protein
MNHNAWLDNLALLNSIAVMLIKFLFLPFDALCQINNVCSEVKEENEGK